MSRGEEKAAVNVEVLLAALRTRISQLRGAPPAEETTQWYQLAGKVAGVGTTTVKKLLDGEPATASTLTRVLDKLHLRAIDLVSLDDQCRIPKEPGAYGPFRHGYFICDLRTDPGKPKRRWCHEEADLRAASTGGTLTVKGTITNEFGKTFDVRGLWIGPYLLTLTATERGRVAAGSGHHSVTSAFTAVFNLCYPLKRLEGLPGRRKLSGVAPGQVLCGFWHGVTCFGTPALYRFFLSTRELTVAERGELRRGLKAMTFLDAGEKGGE